MKIKLFLLAPLILGASFLFAQGTISGNAESTFQYLNEDTVIGANQPPSKALINSYMNVSIYWKMRINKFSSSV